MVIIPDKSDIPIKHGEQAQIKYGVWRWAGLVLNKERILPKLIQPVLDIGGADAPLGHNSIIVDVKSQDILGNEIKYHSIQDINFSVNTIFSSHLLEHLENPVVHINRCWDKLIDGGYYIVQVPSVYNLKNHPIFNTKHRFLFAKEGLVEEVILSRIMPLKPLLEIFFTVEFCEYVPENSLLAIGRK